MKPLFATIKKLPRQRTLTEEVSTANGYWNNDAIQRTIASNVSESCSFTDSLKQGFIRHHLLSVESGNGLLRLLPDSAFVDENMPPRKKVLPVYTGGA
jgi:hypothetical protein